MPARQPEDGTTTPFRQWIATASAGVAIFVAVTAIFIAGIWVINDVVAAGDREIKLAAAFILGLAFLLSVIASIVAAFAALKLTSPRSALGLPEGSIRAIIALVLVLIFVLMGVYLVEAVFLGPDRPAARNAATQLLATLGTLVAAVAAFYFGTSAVTTGAEAANRAASAGRRRAPTAVTKGSELKDKSKERGYLLVGIVNPHGLQTDWYFEYGRDATYGKKTEPVDAGAADAETTVEYYAEEVEVEWHFRLVAFSDAGRSVGKDAEVTERAQVASASIPVVTSVDPAQGSEGTPVVITGSGLRGATEVRFGDVAATPSVDSDDQVTVEAPAGAGAVHVTVTTPAGTSATSDADTFTYENGGGTEASAPLGPEPPPDS